MMERDLILDATNNEMAAGPSGPKLEFWHDPTLGGPSLVRAQYRAHRFERHVHDEMVIAITEKGIGHARARCVHDALGPGTIWVSGLDEYHCGTVKEDEYWHYRAIYLNHQALESIASIFRERAEDRILIPRGIYFDRQLARLLIDVHKKMEAGAPLIERQTIWWSAMGLLFGRYGEPQPRINPVGFEQTKMDVAREYIAANYQSNIAVEDLASLTGLSRYYFIRCFRKEFGLPPHAYVNQLRLIAAKQLLSAGGRPAHVASAVGFYDQSHLNRLFKRSYGMTPGTYASAIKSSRNETYC